MGDAACCALRNHRERGGAAGVGEAACRPDDAGGELVTKTEQIKQILEERYVAGVPYGGQTAIAAEVDCTRQLVQQVMRRSGIARLLLHPQRYCRDCDTALSSNARGDYCQTHYWERYESRLQHGTASMYENGPCRCGPCTLASREQAYAYRQRRIEAGDFKHGVASSYFMYLCRCDECRAAGSIVNKQDRARRLASGKEPPQHGTRNGYIAYGCRCDECRAAEKAYGRARTHRRRHRKTPQPDHSCGV